MIRLQSVSCRTQNRILFEDGLTIDIKPGLRQGLGQEGQQSLAIDGLACSAHGPLLGQPDQKTPIDEGHAGAAALLAKATVVTGAGMEIFTLHG